MNLEESIVWKMGVRNFNQNGKLKLHGDKIERQIA